MTDNGGQNTDPVHAGTTIPSWTTYMDYLLINITGSYSMYVPLQSVKGFVNRLSHNFHIDIDCDILTAYCTRSSSGDNGNLLSRTIIYNTTVVSDQCIKNPAYGWCVSI